jgi:hypothetical protein
MILIVGYQAENTLGKKLVMHEPVINILGETRTVKAEVVVLNSFSGHADRNELLQYIRQFDRQTMKHIFLVHSDFDQAEKLASGLMESGFPNVSIPVRGRKLNCLSAMSNRSLRFLVFLISSTLHARRPTPSTTRSNTRRTRTRIRHNIPRATSQHIQLAWNSAYRYLIWKFFAEHERTVPLEHHSDRRHLNIAGEETGKQPAGTLSSSRLEHLP